jgi:hypothetical protein
LKDEEYKKEIEKLTSQLAFKERELKEITSSINSTTSTITDTSSSSSPVHKNASTPNGNSNKRYINKETQDSQVTKKIKSDTIDKENQILRASVSSLKERLKRVKRALYVILFYSFILIVI